MKSYSADIRRILDDREVDPELAAVRHLEYHDLTDVVDADPNYGSLERGQLRFLERAVKTGPGLVMVRHAPPGIGDEPSLFAELRPLDPFRAGTRRHNFTDKNGNLWGHHRGLKKALPLGWQDHVDRAEQADDHRGTNNSRDHQHVVWAKYLFPPGGRQWRGWSDPDGHDHNPASKLHRRDPQPAGPHMHFARVADPAVNRAKRLDVHPWAVPLFTNAQVVYLAMESVLKADAILTDILRRKAPASVADFASVTLWDCHELPAFVRRYLRGKTVVLVPDADWEDPRKRGAILAQSLFCRTRLEDIARRGAFPIRVVVAAPDAKLGKGVDDYLHADGRLEDMRIVDRQLPRDFDDWRSTAPTFPGRRRDARVLRLLSLVAAADGTTRMPLATVARRSVDLDGKRMDRKAAREALMSLEKSGVITSDRPLTTATYKDGDGKVRGGKWVGYPDFNPYVTGTGFLVPGLEWAADIPTLTVASGLRSTTNRDASVQDLFSQVTGLQTPH